jgi:hypothetical protein
MQHAECSLERGFEGQKPQKINENENHSHLASPAKRSNLFAPGNKGKPKGAVNRVTKTIREAVIEAVQPGACHPEGLTGWLVDRALGGVEDRKIFAGVISRVIPVEITGEGGGPVKIDLGWLTGRKVGGEVIDITPTTQTLGEQAAAQLPTDYQSESPVIAEGVEGQTAKGKSSRPQKAKP